MFIYPDPGQRRHNRTGKLDAKFNVWAALAQTTQTLPADWMTAGKIILQKTIHRVDPVSTNWYIGGLSTGTQVL